MGEGCSRFYGLLVGGVGEGGSRFYGLLVSKVGGRREFQDLGVTSRVVRMFQNLGGFWYGGKGVSKSRGLLVGWEGCLKN